MNLHNFEPDRPIHEEAAILVALGRPAASPLFVRGLRELAWKGARLRKRYENACNYAWANSDSYRAGSDMIEKAIFGLARDCGLNVYIQGDCRGAVVYVAHEALTDNNYSSRGQALFYAEDGQ